MNFDITSVVKIAIVTTWVVALGVVGVFVTGSNDPAPRVQAASVVEVAPASSQTAVTVNAPDASTTVVYAPAGAPIKDEVPVHLAADGTWSYGEPYTVSVAIAFALFAIFALGITGAIYMMTQILRD